MEEVGKTPPDINRLGKGTISVYGKSEISSLPDR
jgi:hypothetical protein